MWHTRMYHPRHSLIVELLYSARRTRDKEGTRFVVGTFVQSQIALRIFCVWMPAFVTSVCNILHQLAIGRPMLELLLGFDFFLRTFLFDARNHVTKSNLL